MTTSFFASKKQNHSTPLEVSNTDERKLSTPLRLCLMSIVLLIASCGSGGSGEAFVDEEIPAVTAETGENFDSEIDNEQNSEVVETADILSPGTEVDESSDTETTEELTGVVEDSTDQSPTADLVADDASIPVTVEDNNPETEPVQTVETTETVELTPIALLLEEVRLAGADPVNTINSNLASGVTLTQAQNDCLGTFDPAVGEQLTQIDCAPFDTSVSVFDTELQAIAVSLAPSSECEASLLTGQTDNCMLSSADLLLPIIWIPIENPSPGQIATVTPIDGGRFLYNLEQDGRLIFESVGNTFVPFRCVVDIDGGFLVETEESLGNCEAETSRLINQLFALRTGM